MEYFTYEELKAIKRQVMLQHSWSSAADVLKGLSLWSHAEELHKAFKYSDHEKTGDGESQRRSEPHTHQSQHHTIHPQKGNSKKLVPVF